MISHCTCRGGKNISEEKKRTFFDKIAGRIENLEMLVEELKRSFDRPSWDSRSSSLEPLCNVFITSEKVLVTTDLPYVDTKSIKIKTLSDEQLEIKAKMKRSLRFRDFGVTYREGEFHAFRCLISIPVPVQMNKMETTFKKGILEIHIPRKKGVSINIE